MSKRDTRRYAERAIPEAIVRRVLEAGRLAGSSRNREPWRFVIVADPALRERLAGLVYRPANVRGAALVVSGRGPVAFDAGRAAQNMMLSARNDDVASCPNGAPDPAPVGELLGLGEDDRVAIVLSFGFPHRTRDPAARPTEAWAARADRRPLQEPIERLKAHPSRRAAATGRRARRVWCTGWSSGEARPDRFRIEDDRSDPRAPRRCKTELQTADCRFVPGAYRSDRTRLCAPRRPSSGTAAPPRTTSSAWAAVLSARRPRAATRSHGSGFATG